MSIVEQLSRNTSRCTLQALSTGTKMNGAHGSLWLVNLIGNGRDREIFLVNKSALGPKSVGLFCGDTEVDISS